MVEQITIEAKIEVTNTLIEQEAFKDNKKIVDFEGQKIKRALKEAETGADQLEEILPKLEQAAEALGESDTAASAENIVQNLVQE